MYQLWYRVKTKFLNINRYGLYSKHPVMPLHTTQQQLLISHGTCSNGKSFNFLNSTHVFEQTVDWNFNGNGKLWNYNLQYFDYLFEPLLNEPIKQQLIIDFATQLLQNKVKPEPYPVSLRLMNWIIYTSQSGLSNPVVEKALKLQVHYLENNLEHHIQANHLLENYFSLSVAALYLQDAKLTKKAWLGLQKQLQEQVLNDGAHYECSPMYHSIILSRLLLLLDILKNNKYSFFEIEMLENIAAKMLGWLQAFCFNNKSWAHCNDATEGIVIDTPTLFNVAAAMKIPVAAVSLSASGYRRLSNTKFDVLFDAGDIIPAYQPGHAHSDMLQVVININDQPFLVDRGTSTYEANTLRLQERSTSAHNTVTINNNNQSAVWSSFRVARRAKILSVASSMKQCKAAHNGYLYKGVVHERSIHIAENRFEIIDILRGSKANLTAEAHFHFDHSVKPVVNTNMVNTNKGVAVLFSGHQSIELFSYQQALGFNKRVESYKLVVRFNQQLITQFEAA
ncbi:MAG: hypothetical protein EAZ16_08690 [Sphingobacteriales bacterium]|nr:MAG: hypothetical protein EAZ16_08690 [Sphingobacteriales bacterium]